MATRYCKLGLERSDATSFSRPLELRRHSLVHNIIVLRCVALLRHGLLEKCQLSSSRNIIMTIEQCASDSFYCLRHFSVLNAVAQVVESP
jgi:hypothetical protein